MERQGGYAGSISYTDLSEGKSVKKPLELALRKNFLGGAGISAKLAYELIKPAAAPLSPGNVLVFGVGPFVGTLIPGAGKCNITGKSPISRLIGVSSSGHLGMLKFAGYDHLVVTGKADRPVYLKICDDEVEIREATHIWGKDTWEATDALWDELGKEYTVLCIGQAGENLVKIASIIGDKYSAFARSGLGAIMGSKNLKAIAVYGTRGIKVAEVNRFTELLARLHEEFMAQPLLREWRVYGTLLSLEAMAKTGLYPYKNFQETLDIDEALKFFNLDAFLQIKSGDVACLGCPIGCKHFLELSEGKYAGLTLSVSCANAAMQAWGSYVGTQEWEEVFRDVELCNRLGLDYYDTAHLIAWAIELYQREMIGKKDTGGLELNWSKAEVIQDLIQKIAYRQGLGEILAQGLLEASQRIGRKSEDYAVQTKGSGCIFDPRVRLSAESFSQLTNVRGHPSAVTVTMLPRSPGQMRRFAERMGFPPPEVRDRVLTGSEEFSPARIAKWFEDNVMVFDSLGICQFPPFQRFNLAFWADLYSVLTGIEMTSGELLKAGERGWTVKRAFNLREGASRKDDSLLPRRFVREPVKVGKEERSPLKEENIAKLIDEYYQERGWNPDGSIPGAKLQELGLEGII